MADRIGGIFIDIGVNSAAFSAGLTKAQGQVQKFAVVTKSSLGKLGTAAFGGLASGALATIAPILGVAAAVDTMKRGLEEFGAISDAAKASGLDSEFLQGLSHAASLGGITFEQLSASLANFNRASGQAEAGTGRMAAALAKLNPALLKSLQAAETQEERVRLAADAINAAGSASEKAALSVALFGDAGTKLVDVFNGGAAAIDAATNKARALGIVISREVIASADEMGDRFDTATKVLDLQFKSAMVSLAPVLISTAELVGGVSAAIGGLFDEMRKFEDRSTASLQSRLDTINAILESAAKDVTLPSGEIVNSNPMALSPGGADLDKLAAERKELEAILSVRKALAVEVPTTPPGGDTPNAAAQAKIEQAKAILTALEFEAAQLGRTSLQQEIYNQLKAAGVTAESAFGQQIIAATTNLESQRSVLEKNAEAMKVFGDIAKSATRTFIDDLIEGKSAAEALGGALGQLGDRLLDMALDQAITGLLGSLFGAPAAGKVATSFIPGLGSFASGTANTGGVRGQARGVVHGQEAVIPLPNGGRVPVNITSPTDMSAGTGGAIAVSVSVGVQNGQLIPLIAQVSGEVAGKQINQRVPAIVKQVAPGAVRIASANRTG